jgi:curved DNA-binding protein
MARDEPFIDFYDVLRVHRSCDARMLETAYHELLKVYHPDHSRSEDTAKFNRLIHAYRVLRDPAQRAEYDVLHAQVCGDSDQGEPADGQDIGQKTALDDAEAHTRVLMSLYKARRENAQNAGVVGYYLQNMLECSDEEFEFHKWYLKEKGFVVVTEHGTLAITIEGIDHVIASSRTATAEKLLIGRSRSHPDAD